MDLKILLAYLGGAIVGGFGAWIYIMEDYRSYLNEQKDRP